MSAIVVHRQKPSALQTAIALTLLSAGSNLRAFLLSTEHVQR